jgi:hypothetical protein
MEPLSDKQEQQVRERLRQHEFPFDERAWLAMEALLAESQRPGAVRPGWRYGWWVLLLAIASALLLGQARPTQRKELDAPALPAGSVAEGVQGSGQGKRALSADDNWISGKAENKGAERASGQRFPSDKKTNAEVASVPSTNAGNQRRTSTPTPVGILSPPSMEEDFRRSKYSPASSPSFTGDPEGSAGVAEGRSQTPEVLRGLPSVTGRINPTRLTQSNDVPLLPPADMTPQPPRIEHGLAIGLGTSVMQWRPLTVTPAPVLGYLFRYRFGGNTSLQAEAQVKSVSGYALGAQIQENTPTGPLMVSHEVDGLLFFELPIGVHHRYRPTQAIFVGIRPAWNMPMHKQTTALLSSPTPTSDYSIREGLRAFDVGVSAGWEWRLHPQWALDARLTQGTVNLASAGFFHGVDGLYNTDLQISLRYFTAPDKRALATRL